MTPRNRLSLILMAVACLLAAYLLHTQRLGVIGTILVVAFGVIAGRGVHRGGIVPTPLGQNRSYSLRPAAVALFKGFIVSGVAMTWAFGVALAVRSGRLPDNEWTAFGLLLIPLLGLLALAGTFISKAILIARFGIKK